MNARALHFGHPGVDEFDVRSRTRWTMTMSVLVHAILLLLLLWPRPEVASAPALTEITLLGPGDLDPAPAASAPSADRSSSTPSEGVRVSSADDRSFRRLSERADVSPDPHAVSVADRMTARLAAMRSDVSAPVASSSAVGGPSSLWSTPAGASGGTGTGGPSLSLSRGGGGSGAPLTLGRGGGTGVAPALAAAGSAPVQVDAPASAPEGEVHAKRTLAGAQLAGPIADRAVLRHATPVYPEWAKRDGVEATVTLYFIVRADGSVKENILVQKTAGFGDFDDSARAALAAWRFEPLRGGRTGEQWGTITFHFRLRGA